MGEKAPQSPARKIVIIGLGTGGLYASRAATRVDRRLEFTFIETLREARSFRDWTSPIITMHLDEELLITCLTLYFEKYHLTRIDIRTQARMEIIVAFPDQFGYGVSFCIHIHVDYAEAQWQLYRRDCSVAVNDSEIRLSRGETFDGDCPQIVLVDKHKP